MKGLLVVRQSMLAYTKSIAKCLMVGFISLRIGMLCIASILTSLVVSAQDYAYKNFTKDDGLPGSEVYDLIQDQKGYIWLATSFGVARYDGDSFTTYTTADGLAGNSTITITEDSNGKIWFSSYSGDISYFENNKFYIHPRNDTIKMLAGGFVDLQVDKHDNLYFTSKVSRQTNFRIPACGSVNLQMNEDIPEEVKDWGMHFKPTDFGVLWCTQQDYVPNAAFQDNEVAYIDSIYYVKYVRDNSGEFFKCRTIGTNEYLVALANQIIHLKDHRVLAQKSYQSSINDIYVDHSNNFWISIENDGTLMYPNGMLQAEPKSFFPGIAISNVIQDRDGSYWFSSNGKGVFVVPSLDIKCVDVDGVRDTRIISINASEEKVIFGNWGMKMYEMDPYTLVTRRIDKEFFPNGTKVCNDLMIDHNRNYWILSPRLSCFSESKEEFAKKGKWGGYQVLELRNNDVAIASYFALHIYHDYKLQNILSLPDGPLRTRCLYEDSDQNLWVGTLDGLYQYRKGELQDYGDVFPVFQERIASLCGNNEVLVVGTRGSGLVMVHGNKFHVVTEKDGIRGNNIEAVLLENDSTLWIGTNKGLSCLHFEIDDVLEFTYDNYHDWEGLPSTSISDMIMLNNRMFLGTEKGVAHFDPRKLEPCKTPPRVYIENVKINDSDTVLKDRFLLKYQQNKVSIRYNGLHFKSIGEVVYNYCLYGLDDKWHSTSNNRVDFVSLPPGRYHFMVYAQNINGVFSDKAAELRFSISKPFWNEPLFILMLVIFVSGIVFFFIHRVMLYQKLKSQREQELLKYQQMALSKQLNPHFLFNSLNSVQRFILENDKISSTQYLSQFARLMRVILDMSNKHVVSLNEEIDSLKLYLDIESMRLKESFRFAIKVDPSINKDKTMIPSFIIQPFAENAIWHGLIYRNQNNRLDIEFFIQQEYLVCRISDNGIGRKNAMSYKHQNGSGDKKSYGISTTQGRLDLFNKRYNTDSRFVISDVLGSNGEINGTRVEIFFSVGFEY